MLQVDPLKRATIEDIKGHDWFKKDLPVYLFPQANDDSASIDMDAVMEVCEKFGVQERDVNTALLSGDPHDQLSIAYHLIVDNKRIEGETAKLDNFDFYVGHASPPPASYMDRVMERAGSLTSRPRRPSGLSSSSGGNTTEKTVFASGRGTPMKRAKWHLGIRSQSKPNDIMNEVFRAMKALDFEWKVVNAFHVRCRKKNPVTGRLNKMSLQLYQVDYKSYLLDFKSLSSEIEASGNPTVPAIKQSLSREGSTSSSEPHPSHREAQSYYVMEFFEMCAALITQLAR